MTEKSVEQSVLMVGTVLGLTHKTNGGTLLSGIFMQLCKTVKKRQLAHVFVYRIGHVDFAEQFRQWYLL